MEVLLGRTSRRRRAPVLRRGGDRHQPQRRHRRSPRSSSTSRRSPAATPSSSRSARSTSSTRPRSSRSRARRPFGATNGDLKRGLEFGQARVPRDRPSTAGSKAIAWFASCWDEASVDFIDQFDPPCYKIASASPHRRRPAAPHPREGQADHALDRHEHARADRPCRRRARQGGSRSSCTAAAPIPSQYAELNLRAIPDASRSATACRSATRDTRPGSPSSVAAVALGACVVERHVTLDRAMWGSDHAASLEPNGIMRLVRDIRLVETALGDGVKRGLPVGDPDHEEAAAGRALSVAIKAVAMDVDGVLTDGTVWLDEAGRESKRISFADIMGISIGRRAGLLFALVSGEDGPLLDAIAAKIGITRRLPGLQGQGRGGPRLRRAARPGARRGLLHRRRRQRRAGPGDLRPGGRAGRRPRRGRRKGRRGDRRPGGGGAVREVIDALLARRWPAVRRELDCATRAETG